jgi:hypothetical protein
MMRWHRGCDIGGGWLLCKCGRGHLRGWLEQLVVGGSSRNNVGWARRGCEGWRNGA